MQRLWILAVIGDQQNRQLVDRHLRHGFQQTRRETRVEGAQHIRFGHGARADAPIARRRVVHRIGEARRRDFPPGERERLAEIVAIVPIPAGGGENARERRGVLAGLLSGLERHGQGKLHDPADAPPLGSRKNRGNRQHSGHRLVSLSTRQHGGRLGPIGEARPQHSEAADVGGQHHAARPKIRLQFAPPKPNEFERTRMIGARRLSLI